MAQIDSSIYQRQEAPELIGSYFKGREEGLRLKELGRQKKLQEDLKSATVVDAAGNVSYDQSKLGALGRENPLEVMEIQRKQRADKAAMTKQRFEEFHSKVNLGAQMLGGVTDENTYQAVRPQLIANGIFEEKELPPQFDSNFIKNQRMRALSVKEMLDHEIKKQNQDFTQMDSNRNYALKKEENKAKVEELRQKANGNKVTMASELRKERNALPVTKATQEVSVAYNKIQNAAKADSAAGDLAMIFNYMKMLDPSSVVRESEFKTAEQARAWMTKAAGEGYAIPSFVQQGIQRLEKGTFLLPEQRMDFTKQAGNLYRAQIDQQRKADMQYAELANQAGIDAKSVLTNFDANAPEAADETHVHEGITYKKVGDQWVPQNG